MPNHHGARTTFDAASRLLTIGSGDGLRVLTAEGFAPGSRTALAPPERQAARFRAFSLLRDATRHELTGSSADALERAAKAVAEARTAGDESLTEWASRVHGRLAIQAGRLAAGERELAALAESSDTGPNVAWELGRALHLAGDLAGSARWYRWGLARAESGGQGRQPYEFLEGLLFALAEGERWDDAEQAVDRFEAAIHEASIAASYRGFVLWRRGAPDARLPKEAREGNDLVRYWALETRLAAGEPLDLLSRELEAERRAASETPTLLLSLSAEIEARRGNLPLALERASRAFTEVKAARARHPWARAHAPLLAERLATLAKRAGRSDLLSAAREGAAAIRSR